MEYKYTGIILNKRDVGETDRIYTMYTLEGGKVKSLAKGVRKPHAKLASALENFTLADITIVRTQGLGKITGSIVEHNFGALKKDGDAILDAFAAAAVFDKLVDFDHADAAVFDLLKNYLEALDACACEGSVEKYALLRLGFLVKLLEALGYTMEAEVCVSCRRPLSEDAVFFSAQQGGTLCSECAKDAMGSSLVRANAIKLIRLFLSSGMKSLSKIQVPERDLDSARQVVDDFLRWNT